MKRTFFPFAAGALIGALTFLPPLQAAYTFKDGKLIDAALTPTMPLEGHYQAGLEAYQACNWREAARHFGIAAVNFPLSPYGQEAAFYQGVANYHLGEYDLADEAFTLYLQGKSTPRLFEETIAYKFLIAEQFRHGAKRRLLGTKQLPKWAPADGHAIKIYEEIIAAVPCHEYAVQSLYSKGLLHWTRREFSQAVESFQMIIRRFPKHEYAPECYLLINRVYLDQCRSEFQNPDMLAFAEINTRRFAQSFPREPRLAQAEEDVLCIKEVYAQGFYDTGLFYERIGRPQAAALYYRHAVIQFPETQTGELSRQRLWGLGYEVAPEEKIAEDHDDLKAGSEVGPADGEIKWIP